MKRKLFRKADIVLLILLVVIGAAGSVWVASGHHEGSTVVIKSGGSVYGTYPLSEDRTVTVTTAGGSRNTVEIRDGAVRVTEASCRNQVCVRHAAITRSGESVICLPNKLIVTIEGTGKEGGGNEIDAVSN